MAELHVLCLVITCKSDIIGSNIKRHSVYNVSLEVGAVTNTAFDISWKARHSSVIARIPHHRIVLPVWETDINLTICLVLIMNLTL